MIINFFPLLSMKPVATGKILDTDIYAIKNKHNNLFAFMTGDGYTLIDAGSDLTIIKEAFDKMSIDIARVKNVLLTHTDSDHVASLSLFTNTAIYMSEDEKQMIDGKTKRNAFSFNALPKEIDIGSLILLSDKQDLILGERTIQCIKVPGHTLGSMAYLLDGKYMFTGDSIKINNDDFFIHPFSMDKNSAKTSIARINSLRRSCKLIITSHYGYIR